MLKYLYQKLFPVKLPDTENYVPTELEPYVILFGSRLWGGAKKSSDVDLLIREFDVTTIKTILTSLNLAFKENRKGYSNVLKSITFNLNNLHYQISVQSYKEFKASEQAIPIMAAFSKTQKKVSKKEYRVDTYTSLYDHFRYQESISVLPKDLQKFLTANYPELLI